MTMMAADPLAMFADAIDPQDDPYINLPADWSRAKLGEHVTVDQEMIMQATAEHRHVAVASCHDVGKSFTGARLAAWWIDVHPPGEAFVVTTAPTWAQVAAILWRELGRAHRKGNLIGDLTATCEWKIDMGAGPSELVAYGRKPADYDPSAFQGIHARYVLIIVDEACGVPKTLFDAAESIATNVHARIVAIGNPDDPSSYFAEVCAPGSGWHIIYMDALRSPNFTNEILKDHPIIRAYMIREGIAPNDEYTPEGLRDLLVSPLWVEERLKRWGERSPLFISKVRGRFPIITQDTLIHPHWVKLAQVRELPIVPSQPRFGVDVARYGSDHTIIMHRQGGHCRVARDIPYGPTTELSGMIIALGGGLNIVPIANVDDTGVGGGVTDELQAERYPCLPLVAGSACSEHETLPNGKPRFVNARSEWWWNTREALAGPTGTGDHGWLDLDPDDDELYAQLTNVKYRVNRHGQIEIESKDALKSRGLPSPDRGDALCYCLVETPVARRANMQRMMTGDLLTRPM